MSSNQMDVDGEEAGPSGAPKTPKEVCPTLYAALLHDAEKLYSQSDLLALNVVPDDDLDLLARCMNTLHEQHRVRSLTRGGTLVWKVVARTDAARYKGLSRDETIVLSHIDTAQNEGIWTRYVQKRSQLHQTNVDAAVRKLIQRNLIKSVPSAKFPKRKIMMLAHLEPSEDLTGGPFFENGVLEEDLVYVVTQQAYRYIASRSWDWSAASRKGSSRNKHPPSAEAAEAMRSDAMQRGDGKKGTGPWPLPPGYSGYPNLKEITGALNDLGLLKVNLVEGDVQQLLDLLCWDGRIVKVMAGSAYKSVKGKEETTEERRNTNGLTEIPCGRCPVFEWCEDGGPVNAKSCTYFADWLAS